MSLIDHTKNYQRLFQFNNIGYIVGDIWTHGYSDIEAMAFSVNDHCSCWLSEASMKETLQKGVEFFSDENKFRKYKEGFEDLLNSIPQDYQKNIFQVEKTSAEEIKSFLENLAESFRYFYKTEFFFVDEAFKASKNNPTIKKNLEINYRLKERGRIEFINKVTLGKEAYLNVLFDRIGKEFNLDKKDLPQYGIKEIGEIYEGKILSKEEIDQRKIAWISLALNNEVQAYFGDQTVEDINALLKEKVESIIPQDNILRGIVANKGRLNGRVKVIVSDPKTFDSLDMEFIKMNKGDVLVAETTSPEFMPACQKASAILTNQGGMLSHAAVISREFGIPCIVGLKVATQVLKDGDLVEVNADEGIVRILK